MPLDGVVVVAPVWLAGAGPAAGAGDVGVAWPEPDVAGATPVPGLEIGVVLVPGADVVVPVTTAPFADRSERKPAEFGGWMFDTACWTAPPDEDRKPIASGDGITMPIPAAIRSIR